MVEHLIARGSGIVAYTVLAMDIGDNQTFTVWYSENYFAKGSPFDDGDRWP